MMARGTGTVQADAASTTKWLSGHLRYLRYRRRAPQESLVGRRLFSATCDEVRQRAALAALGDSACRQLVAHKLLLAPEDEDGPVQDWRAWTRQVMRTLAAPPGQACGWIAVVHQQPTPHVHVVLTSIPAAAPRQRAHLRLVPPGALKEAN